MNEVARKRHIYVQPLANEVILYDKMSHQAHSLNETVFRIWQNADGTKSVDQLAALLTPEVSAECTREVVLLALEELRRANLLDGAATAVKEELPSRRDIATKLSRAGLSASLLPFVTSIIAPTPAMARSGNYSKATFEQEYNNVLSEAKNDASELSEDRNGSLKDLQSALGRGQNGISDSSNGKQANAQAEFAQAETEFNDMLKALGLPPL